MLKEITDRFHLILGMIGITVAPDIMAQTTAVVQQVATAPPAPINSTLIVQTLLGLFTVIVELFKARARRKAAAANVPKV